MENEIQDARLTLLESLNHHKFNLELSRLAIISGDGAIADTIDELRVIDNALEIINEFIHANYKFDEGLLKMYEDLKNLQKS